ncbi:MAG TPA: chromosomal replication initiator protein DnaA, partial [Azospirillaceae bacterium]|nr:chromosomal replication initiator protein DnaA [Azospirillaceae bacterium]
MSVQGSLDQQWAKVRGRLKDEVGETAYRSWLKPLTVGEFDGGQVRIVVPTRFMRDWIRTHYADRIRALWSGENPGVQSVEIVVAAARAEAPRPAGAFDAAPAVADAARPAAEAPRAVPAAEPAPEPDMPALPAGGALLGGEERDDYSALLDPRFTFENFVVGKPNELAFAAARRVADASTVTFNPLFLYGGVGLGKTHLMHAIAWHIRKKDPSRRVIYLSAEKFKYQFIRALRYKDTMAFKEQIRSVDVLMIDDVQFISGKDSTQEEFFHTFNALVDQGKQIVLTADRSPVEIASLEERVTSRL